MFIHCRNSSCKNYFEDSCMLNINNKMVCFDEQGKCEDFEEGVCEGYKHTDAIKDVDGFEYDHRLGEEDGKPQ